MCYLSGRSRLTPRSEEPLDLISKNEISILEATRCSEKKYCSIRGDESI